MNQLYLFAAELIFFAFSYVAGIFIVLIFGLFDPIWLSLEIIGGFIVISLFRNYIWRRLIFKKHYQRRKQVLIEFIIFFVLLQVFLSVTVPVSSLIPKTIQNAFFHKLSLMFLLSCHIPYKKIYKIISYELFCILLSTLFCAVSSLI